MTLAQLYDAVTFPLYAELKSAHDSLDKTILVAYGLKPGVTDAEILAELFKRYEALTKADQLPLPVKKAARKRAAKKVPDQARTKGEKA